MSFEVITSPNFDRELKKLAKRHLSIKTDLAALVKSLKTNPFQGDGLGKDCYKVRMKISSKGKGKSGGARVITYVKIVANQVSLLAIYDKSEQDDISNGRLLQILKENALI